MNIWQVFGIPSLKIGVNFLAPPSDICLWRDSNEKR